MKFPAYPAPSPLAGPPHGQEQGAGFGRHTVVNPLPNQVKLPLPGGQLYKRQGRFGRPVRVSTLAVTARIQADSLQAGGLGCLAFLL